MKLFDAHCHLYKFSNSEIGNILKEITVISVADDLKSSIKNIKLSYLYENLIPAVGIHPWRVNNVSKKSLNAIENLIKKENIKILGEIGLDKKFVPETFNKQKEVFEFFLNLAKEHDLSLNFHTPNTWKEVYDLLIKYDIKKAYFHWYTGPIELLKEIQDSGYFVGINVAVDIQEKHRKILEEVDVNLILLESDGPYNYKGKTLHPYQIKETVKYVSDIKQIPQKEFINILRKNFAKFII